MNGIWMIWYSVVLCGGADTANRDHAAAHPACQIVQCVPELSTTIKPRVYFECESKEYCLPRCRLPCFWRKREGVVPASADCPPCGKVRVRRVLIKKVATEESPSWRCVPKTIRDMPCEIPPP